MASSDDEGDVGPRSVSNYYFEDDKAEPISFAVLPIQWSTSESVDGMNNQEIFLRGTAEDGLQIVHKQVMAWKFDISNVNPEISVLTKKSWIKLQKPRKSFEEMIRAVLATVHFLHYAKRNPEASMKSVWDRLSKDFNSYEVGLSPNDLVEHMALIGEAVKRDNSLADCKLLRSFLEEPRSRSLVDEAAQVTTMSSFIVDDVDVDIEENDSNEEEELFDSVCAFCDNGGDILSCEGKCMRSFHATLEAGEDSLCESLGFTNRKVEAMQSFFCKNCEYKVHQCFACGKLGSSDKNLHAEVFQCANATCGHFYHPRCVAKLLHLGDDVAAEDLQGKIAAGVSFACPFHKCCICKQVENKQVSDLQFAVCRRCPTSYHRRCLPREIVFENSEDEDVVARAWGGLLPNRILIYCLKHEIDDEIGTPVRDHIKFPDDDEKKTADKEKKRKAISEFPASRDNLLSKKRRLTSGYSFSGRNVVQTSKELSSGVNKAESSKQDKKVLYRSESLRKVVANDSFKKSAMENLKSVSRGVGGSAAGIVNRSSLGNKLYALKTKKSQAKLGKQDMPDSKFDKSVTAKTAPNKLSSDLPSLGADTETRLLALMKDAASSITLDDVIKNDDVPSTHAYSSKTVVDKTITVGKVEGAVEAVRTALKKLEENCSIEDAKAVCEPGVLNQVFKWKNKLKVYLAPFLYGPRYSSFGRHFTKIEKLQEIVDILHLYVQTGDMIVDFCCGANDFSCLMKKKLEETGKKCSYKNYDIVQPKNDFNFEMRDWMTVSSHELPRGSQLIMGLNPPFGVKAALANKFIDEALEFKPKLLVLIVPPETERLDKKKSPYDLIWEDDQLLSGKSFYLPGSIDQNDKQMEQWNVNAPLLYLWSHCKWSSKHKAIAQKHGHVSRRCDGLNLENPHLDAKESDCKENSSPNDGDKEIQDSHGDGVSSKAGRGDDKLGRGMAKKPVDRKIVGKPPLSNTHTRKPSRSPSNMPDVRSSMESPASASLQILSHADVGEVSNQNLEPGASGSPLLYGTGYGINRAGIQDRTSMRYSNGSDEPYMCGIHRLSTGATLEDQLTRHAMDCKDSSDHGSIMAGLEMESDIWSQAGLFGQDPDPSVQLNYPVGLGGGYGRMESFSSMPRGHIASMESSYRMNMSATERYAPQLDELNHTMMSSLGSEPPMFNINDGIYDPRAPHQHGYRVESMGFAPGPPHHPYGGSAGWLND